jgi:hypothetical protein
VDNLHGVLNDADCHQLLTVVAAVHHQRVSQTLNNGALSLSESLLLVATSSVGDELLVLVLGVKGEVVLVCKKKEISVLPRKMQPHQNPKYQESSFSKQ